ncbi:unnamed protein product [Alternaria alternata]
MARQPSDANSHGRLPPPKDVQSSESSRSRSHSERTGANSDGATIKLAKSKFYDECGEKLLYRAGALPYESQHEPIGAGAHAKVYKTTIRRNSYDEGRGPISTEVKIARKEFSGTRAKENFLIENKICRAFHKLSAGIPKVIVTPLFSYAVEDTNGNVEYNICFELARCDLKTWLSDKENFRSGDKYARITNIEHMYGIAKGLQWLTDTTTCKNGFYGPQKIMHRDLHWRNILVFEDDNSRDGLIFKIGDFGNATRVQESEKRHKPTVSSAVTGWARRGQFSAPETKPNEKSDVWSFGCNLLLVLLFNCYGGKGIQEFLSSLLRYSSHDWFYDSNTLAASHETTSCIEHLRRYVKHDPDRLVTIQLLSLLQKRVLVPLKARWSILEVVKELERCLNKQNTVEPKIMVEREKEYQHCAHAPEGRFEMFHHQADEYTMSVWIWNGGMVSELPFLEPIAAPRSKQAKNQPKRIYPHSSCCGKEHICQVIANSQTLEVFLYQVQKNATEPVSREFIRLTDIKEVSRVALAPSSQYIAVDADRRLRLYETEQLLENMNMIDQLSGSGTVPEQLSLIGVNSDKLDLLRNFNSKRRQADETVILTFSLNNEFLYHAYRTASPECGNSSYCKIAVRIWSTKERTQPLEFFRDKDDVEIEQFLTGFTPFNKCQELLIVTCNNRLTRHTFDSDGNEKPRFHIDIQDKIVAILISPDDEFAVLLGEKEKLSVHLVDLREGRLRYHPQNELKLSKTQIFDPNRDAASIIDRETLLITFHNGLSVHITLRPALDMIVAGSDGNEGF